MHIKLVSMKKGIDAALIRLARPWEGPTLPLSGDQNTDPVPFSSAKPSVSSLVAISGFESTKLEDTGLISAFLDASGEAYLAV